MKLTVYWHPRCGTCRQAVKWLEEHSFQIEKIDLVENPPSEQELNNLIAASGLEIKHFFNVSGTLYREMGMKEKMAELNDAEKIKLLSENGKLIKRPIVTNGEKATVGFHKEQFEHTWLSGKLMV